MSDHVVAPLNGLSQAMCLACGAVRSAKAQYLGRGSRSLRCEPCDQVTVHAAVNWHGPDLREEANLKRSLANAEVSREHQSLLRLFKSCQIEIIVGDADPTSYNGDPQGGLVDIVRWVEPQVYLVRLRRGLSLADRVYCLDWAWKSMRPAIAEWHRCVVETDLDGQPFQRIYNNELERGTYTLS